MPTFDADPAALARYGASLQQLATAAAAHGIKVCIEHFPGRALPTAAATLAFIKGLGHDNLYLLLDLGHLQMSGEDPAAVIQAAGNRLGYVHLDDNDGVGDLHWALLDGVMTEASLGAALAALREVGYGGPLSLELSPRLPDVPPPSPTAPPPSAACYNWQAFDGIAAEEEWPQISTDSTRIFL
ncbi:MAG: TIM barrel protein [Ardenticatenales bacterium]|nr:TIM barrel protein [Ardenticatenales bacterium]